MAVLPMNGIRRDTAIIALKALNGTPFLSSVAKVLCASPDLAAAKIRRLKAIMLPIRLVIITAKSANIRTVTPVLPR